MSGTKKRMTEFRFNWIKSDIARGLDEDLICLSNGIGASTYRIIKNQALNWDDYLRIVRGYAPGRKIKQQAPLWDETTPNVSKHGENCKKPAKKAGIWKENAPSTEALEQDINLLFVKDLDTQRDLEKALGRATFAMLMALVAIAGAIFLGVILYQATH